MTLTEYQNQALETAIYPGQGHFDGLMYATLGLAGEAGEVANKVKKVLRDQFGEISEEARQVLVAEVGDCMWYISALASELGFSLEEVARRNLMKLAARKQTDTIKGSGDER